MPNPTSNSLPTADLILLKIFSVYVISFRLISLGTPVIGWKGSNLQAVFPSFNNCSATIPALSGSPSGIGGIYA